MAYDVTFALPVDLDACLAFCARMAPCFADIPPQALRQQLANHIETGQAVCAKDGGTVIGLLLFSVRLCAVSALVVDPAFRNKQVASDLLDCMTLRHPALKNHPNILPLYEGAPLLSAWYRKPVLGSGGSFVPPGLPARDSQN